MKKSIAILTNFMEFNPGYSLTGIVVEQCRMLLREGHRVIVFVNEQYNTKYDRHSGFNVIAHKYKGNFQVVKKSKFMHLTDYETRNDLSTEHIEASQQAAEMYVDELTRFEVDVVFTHDFIFTGWNLPYAEAIKVASKKLGDSVHWFHWIHSVPSDQRDWWRLGEYGNTHYIIFPNRTEQMRVAEQFRTHPLRVICVPHVKDIRNYYDFGKHSFYFTECFPNIMKADIVQVYPASTDRLSAKQVGSVMKIFAFMKEEQNFNVFLLIANQWATGRVACENIKMYVDVAANLGLEYGENFAFTSLTPGVDVRDKYDFDMADALENFMDDEEYFPYARGISKRTLRELQLLSNLFIYPTVEESFGLVGPEAAYSGALVVINRSLTMMYEIMGHMTPAFDFGSHHQNHPQAQDDDYLKAVAVAILSRMMYNESMMTRTAARTRYSMDHIYNRYYLPLLMLENVKIAKTGRAPN